MSDPGEAVPRRSLAVLGSPIAHSRSPLLHSAAYRQLGLDWDYGRREVRSGELAGFLGGLGTEWRGLSLTMPLKREVLPLLDEADELVEITGAANTVLLDGTIRGFNTDVGGIEAAFAERGVPAPHRVLILGGGATAASVLTAVARLGATEAVVAVRSPERAAALPRLGARLGLGVALLSLGGELPVDVDLVASTLPGDATPPLPEVAPGTALLDAAYDPWPSTLARHWARVGAGPTVSGLEMLVHQALLQVRIFARGDPGVPLPGEAGVLRAMKAAVGGF
ncbi:MAG: shikimate dehydrogenase [Naasia sp.]|uniref:shikimate dehydrogenase family protein n=1 Tax=Naasia sp. TaxID=2546198 RepID=UPI002603B106|nr:shikimate dehydrogenase [Naasia sp.]MCU1571878.1 shikimate dehydrogenase [Naasia sp.]